MNNPIISLEGVEKRFGSNLVVKKMNLEIAEGEFLTLLGPSGCGKTTTLRMIAGFEEASAGVIKVEGERIEDKEPFQRNVNTVFQNYALFPHMTVFNNVAYGLTIKKVPKPEIQIELKHLQKKLGITFIYVTHDQEEALTMSDRIAVMHDGVLEQLDVPMEIYEHPKTKFVAGFIGESNIFDGKVTDKKDNVLTVQTEAGMMQVCGADFEVGEEMHVAIRPEYMDVSKTPVEGFDLPGTVKDFIYQGTVVKTALDIKNGQEIKYSRFEQDADIAEGNQVYVYWRPEKAVAIKKSM